ncbi:MAG TPA: Bro-N domain-containing protein [Allocoleopsis sp.]
MVIKLSYLYLMENSLLPFEEKKIRSIDHEGETWFSVVDIIEALTDSPNPRNYWSMLKRKEKQLYSICVQLKLQSSDGKMYKTDCANTEGVLRIIQSVPSPKAEPFKMWLAGLGKRELDEIADPELLTQRQIEIYRAKGYSEEWIVRRVQSIEARKRLTDEWKKRGVSEGEEFSILTATIAKGTFGLSPTDHSKVKSLKKENLRDHMTPIELIFTALSEEATRMIAERDDAQGFPENFDAAHEGGRVAGKARENFEKDTNLKVVSPTNFLNLDKTKNNSAELPKDKRED